MNCPLGKRFIRVTWCGQTGSSIAGARRAVQAHMARVGTSIFPGSEEQCRFCVDHMVEEEPLVPTVSTTGPGPTKI